MGGGDVGRHGEAEAGAAAIASAAFVEAHEALHDVGPPRSRDAGPVVVDVDARRPRLRRPRRRAPPCWRGGRRCRRGGRGPGPRAPASPTSGSTSAPTATSTGTRRRRAATSRTRVGDRERRSRANACSSPRASSSRSSTRPWSRSSSPSEHVARRRPVGCVRHAGRPRARCASRRPACATRGTHRRRGGGCRRRGLEPAEHPVHRRGQLGDLVRRRRHGHPLVERVASRSRRPATSPRGPVAAPARRAATPARRRGRRAPGRRSTAGGGSWPRVSRTSSSGDAVASGPPADSDDTL